MRFPLTPAQRKVEGLLDSLRSISGDCRDMANFSEDLYDALQKLAEADPEELAYLDLGWMTEKAFYYKWNLHAQLADVSDALLEMERMLNELPR